MPVGGYNEENGVLHVYFEIQTIIFYLAGFMWRAKTSTSGEAIN